MSLLAEALNQLLDACPEVGGGAECLKAGLFMFPAASAEVPAERPAPSALVTKVPLEP
jgi:hypothetical protein